MNKGFTLIELLVVIAIVGVLSAIVLTQLNSSRSKGADASIKQTLNYIIPKAQLLYDTYGGTGLNESWNGFCSQTEIDRMWRSVTNNGTTGTCHGAGSSGYNVYAQMSNGKYWCVDYNASKKTCDVAPSVQISGSWICATGAPYNCQ